MKVISFETAKLAKEKGFDKEFSYFYVTKNSKIYGIDEYGGLYNVKNIFKKIYKVGDYYVEKEKNAIPDPYQYQLMDWLREEHNIYISIIPSVTMALKSKVSFTYQISSDSNGEKFNIYSSSMDCYSNYEECLETALQEALKMI